MVVAPVIEKLVSTSFGVPYETCVVSAQSELAMQLMVVALR